MKNKRKRSRERPFFFLKKRTSRAKYGVPDRAVRLIGDICLLSQPRNLKCSPKVPEISRLLDEGREPDAGLCDVGGEAALVVDGHALHVQPEDQLVLPELRGQLGNVGPVEKR